MLVGSPEMKGMASNVHAWPVDEEVTSNGPSEHALYVLFSAPLVWTDRHNRFHPIEALDFETEREMLWQVRHPNVVLEISQCLL